MKKEELIEIKKGKTGTGLLIENDGYIKIDKNLIKESNEMGEWHCPNPFIVDAVFQKAGIKNANGRIYPRKILEREIEKYQERIREHRALGECYTPDVLVLCEEGWKPMADVKEGDKVLTLNTKTEEIEVEAVTRKIEYDYDGEMIRLKSDVINDLVTPNHEFWFKTDKGLIKKTAKDLSTYQPNINEYIPAKNAIFLKDIEYSIETYIGQVMCIEVPNHSFFVKSNDFEHLTSNCNHPSESTIDLGRISHNIIELHWEGNTVVGKMELNISEGFRRSGICSTLGDTVANLLLNGYKIGVSSRAVGSVEQRMGVLMVGDDLELLCWDIVSDPSTPNAWVSDSYENLTPYLESDTSKSDKPSLNEKINKLKNILNS